MNNQNQSLPECNYIHNKNFWIFGSYFFLYFFIMATCFPFLPIWLSEVIGLNKLETGIVFSSLSFFAIVFQPILGMISDKLGLKKNLVWIISIALVFFAPFFIYIFAPLLKTNIFLGALVGGLYLGFVFSGGAGAIEAYIERVSRNTHFEYGKARMFGCIGWGICASTAGLLFYNNPNIVFWMGSAAGILLLVLLLLAHPEQNKTLQVMNALGANSAQFNLKMVAKLFKMPKMWMFILYVVGVACVYDVFDQQFATFFKGFFVNPQRGTEVFGFATTAGEAANAIIMFCSPWIINRIGAKRTLIIAGSIMSIRIIGSAFATNAVEVIALKMLHALEVPFLLVGTFKYITSVFDTRLSATIYLIGFQFAKQFSAIFLSTFAGNMYDKIGFHGTYLVLGLIALTVTVISIATLTNDKPKTDKLVNDKYLPVKN
ncbi:MFS transporter [Moellerella wisconsensis]|uniref:Lactose permease n=1 Tax=Moellerella wisconsensis ATCC 35017 TaxID=1354267 RepID=A0A0N0Z7W8_9GAMM|nr:MFS transporter [Moellerella wisconsensis]KPD02937.1 lactose permease [Moellerella wisconsensis ATCC 35017]VFS53743.1 Lactose-proton symport [Moellerella wisconsensis]